MRNFDSYFRILKNNLAKIAFIVTLSVAAECLCVAFSGSMAREYSQRIESSFSQNFKDRPADDLMPYYAGSLIIWCGSLLIAPFIAIKLSFRVFDLNGNISAYVFQILAVIGIIVILRILEPWFFSFLYVKGSTNLSLQDLLGIPFTLITILFSLIVLIIEFHTWRRTKRGPVKINKRMLINVFNRMIGPD